MLLQQSGQFIRALTCRLTKWKWLYCHGLSETLRSLHLNRGESDDTPLPPKSNARVSAGASDRLTRFRSSMDCSARQEERNLAG